MKTKLLTSLFILVLISSDLFGQLSINAGNDTIICVGAWGVDTARLGGNPTAYGGMEPYNYAWSTNYTVGSSQYGASYFLDDSTKANPKLVHDAPDNLKFVLTVTDGSGQHVKDSIHVRFSRFVYTLEDCVKRIDLGDTITLYSNIGGGIDPLTYSWTPNYNISDTSIGNPKAWPVVDTDYQVVANDSIGCESQPDICQVYVNPLGITSTSEIEYKSTVFPNPMNSR